MHQSSKLRMKWFEENYASKINKDKIKVLDVGSYDVNGSYRDIFTDKKYEYVGMDMEKGPNVDLVLNNPYDWSGIETDSYDVIVSGQTFEHIEFFWVTIAEMARVLKKEGLLCIVAPNGFSEHRFPVDCFRYFSDGMLALARYVSLEPLHVHTNCAPDIKHSDWYSATNADSVLIAKKTYSGPAKLVDFKTYKCVPGNLESLRSGLVPFSEFNKSRFREAIKKFLPERILNLLRRIRS